MKGVILAGGTGSRLYPLTKVTNKQLLPVYDKPMIYYPLQTLIQAGIKDVLIISGPDHTGQLIDLLGKGEEFNATISYTVQTEPAGIADAVRLAEDFADDGPITVILGDNIYEDDITPFMERYNKNRKGAHIFLKEVEDPERFGVASVDCGKVVSIVEKPLSPKSNLAVTGLYIYDNTIFSIIKTLKPSDRGEYEITDVNNAYMEKQALTYSVLKGYWTDAGTFESLFEASNLVRRKKQDNLGH